MSIKVLKNCLRVFIYIIKFWSFGCNIELEVLSNFCSYKGQNQSNLAYLWKTRFDEQFSQRICYVIKEIQRSRSLSSQRLPQIVDLRTNFWFFSCFNVSPNFDSYFCYPRWGFVPLFWDLVSHDVMYFKSIKCKI